MSIKEFNKEFTIVRYEKYKMAILMGGNIPNDSLLEYNRELNRKYSKKELLLNIIKNKKCPDDLRCIHCDMILKCASIPSQDLKTIRGLDYSNFTLKRYEYALELYEKEYGEADLVNELL